VRRWSSRRPRPDLRAGNGAGIIATGNRELRNFRVSGSLQATSGFRREEIRSTWLIQALNRRNFRARSESRKIWTCSIVKDMFVVFAVSVLR